jgi:hypothetical protein
MSANPSAKAGDTTPWIAGMKDFIAAYCNARFGADWCVAADYSLKLHAGTTLLPNQVVVHAPLGKNSVLALPNGFSLMDYIHARLGQPGHRIQPVRDQSSERAFLAMIRLCLQCSANATIVAACRT